MILPPDRRKALTAKAQGYTANIEHAMSYLLSRGISRDAAAMFQLGYVTEGQYQGRLSIPYITPAGVVQIKYRDLSGQSSAKYLYESGCGIHLFNAQVLIHASERVVLTEGELDAVAVQAYCGLPAVAYPGVDGWDSKNSKHFRLCFEGVQEILVIADGDKVGREKAREVAESLGYHARVIDLGSGQDSNSYIHQQGAGAFLERLST